VGTTAAEMKKRTLSEAWKKNIELALQHKSKTICKQAEKTNKQMINLSSTTAQAAKGKQTLHR